MATIAGLERKIASLKLPKQVPVLVEQTKNKIIELNQQQLFSGIDGTGEKIKPNYRSKSYAYKKNQINPKPGIGVPDLKITGKFYKSIQVTVNQKSYTITGNDSKSSKLEEKYSKQILRLSPDNRGVYARGVFFDALKSYITGKTGLTFR